MLPKWQNMPHSPVVFAICKITFPRIFSMYSTSLCRSQWPLGLRRGSVAACLLRLWVRNPPGAWMSVCCECYVLSGRGLCDKLIIRPEKSYRLWRVVVCDLETSWMRSPWPTGDCRAKNEQTNIAEVSRPVLKLNPFRIPVKLPAILLSSTWMSFLPSDSFLQHDNFTTYS